MYKQKFQTGDKVEVKHEGIYYNFTIENIYYNLDGVIDIIDFVEGRSWHRKGDKPITIKKIF